MAGLGYRAFQAGEVLTATNVQGYLQDQAVMVFATTAARGSAIGTATEGMMTYIKDVDQVQLYNGTTWIPQAYSQAAGTASSTTGVLATQASTTVSIVFPTNRFSVAPIVQAWTTSPRYVCSPISTTSTGTDITVFNVSGASGTNATVYYQAVQMTSGTAAG